MDILLPMGVGFLLNILIYLIMLGLLKNNYIATGSTFIATITVFVIGLIIGRWAGMGIGVISAGMLLAALLFIGLNTFIPLIRSMRNN